MDGISFVHVAGGPMLLVYYGFSGVLLPVTVWAFVEAIRGRTWRWAITIAVLQPVGAFAWFAAGRRFYR